MVYIQSDKERKLPCKSVLPYSFDSAAALYGAVDSAQDIRLTSYEEIVSGKFDQLIRKHLFVGTVDFMTAVFKRVGKFIPSMENPYQESTIIKLSDAKQKILNGEKWFIKPVQQKLFTGMVFDTMTISQLSSYDDNTDVILCKPFSSRILSETRCYIRFNKIVDARNYSGDFRITSDFKWADDVVKGLENYPSAYTMDIGVLESGENVIIEFNDMWAIGNYGIDNIDYYKLLRERYFEIMRK